MTDEVKNKISKTTKGCVGHFSGRHHTKQTREIISKKMSELLTGKKQRIVKCPYCDKTGGASNMNRYHFDNCKQK